MSVTPIPETFRTKSGSHILYVYSNLDAYVDNAVFFIKTAFRLKQHVVFIEEQEIFARIQAQLAEGGDSSSDDLHFLHYVNGREYYGYCQKFDACHVTGNLETIAAFFTSRGLPMRIWGHVIWPAQPDIEYPLRQYEDNCGTTISRLGYTTVCAYDGRAVPAYIQTVMMHNHEYLMTDELLTQSNLYSDKAHPQPITFPSLFVHPHLESEGDFHEQKTAFLHVISHEVRNPLSVIDGSAAQLRRDEPDASRRQKLDIIRHHTKLIDYEIRHLITTEHLLSNRAWRKETIELSPVLFEIIEIFTLKALTQNMRLTSAIQVDGSELILGQPKGLHLILYNLLNNAIQYGNEGQEIVFSASKANKTPDAVVFKVTDCGAGMSEAQTAALFPPKSRTEPSQGSSGLANGLGNSLTLVWQLVQHFGGDISVDSKLDAGSTFQVEVPLV